MIDVREMFEKHSAEYGDFEKIENPPSPRKDLCAMILLDKLLPSDCCIVSAAEHDQIWFDVDIDELEMVASEEDIIYLIRCGMSIDAEYDCLHKFV